MVCVVEEVAELCGAVVCVVEEVACSGCSCVFLTNEVTGWLNLLLLLQSALNLEKLFSQGELSEVSKPLKCINSPRAFFVVKSEGIIG